MGTCSSSEKIILGNDNENRSIVALSGRTRTVSEMDRLKRKTILDQMAKENEKITPEVRVGRGGRGG